MSIYHDEVEIEDFEYDEEEEMYYYPCPCGDRFQISKEELIEGEEVATCPSCSLIVKVIYDPVGHPYALCHSFQQLKNFSLPFQEMFKAEEDEETALNEKLGELKLEKN
ncbi:hypothetical protein KR018_010964 [Drosophila ironensis]|nr:hypothetical protein KR018_010964 [Drosophila ironensis]